MNNFHPIEDASSTANLYMPILLKMVNVESIIDFGCNVGVWLNAAIVNGVSDVLGVDGDNMRSHLRFPENQFVSHDLTQSLNLGRRFSLAVCVEVAEHIEAVHAYTLINTIVTHADNVFWSAATPGQTGWNHVNEQPHEYWTEKFEKQGYIGTSLSEVLPVAPHDYYRKNAWLFKKT